MAHAYDLDNGYGGAARLGLIVLSTDESIENEARQVIAGHPISLLHSRIPAHAQVTPETLELMAQGMTATAALFPRDMDVIGYACTSGATVIGPDRVARLIRQAQPGAQVTNPITAVTAALHALGAKRIAYASPYVPSVTAPMRSFLAGQGIETVTEGSFDQADDFTVARITENSTMAMLRDLAGQGGVDALFTSCTNLRSFGLIDQIEAETGLPVVSSNQALIWHMLRLAGQDARGWGPGRLFAL